MVLVSKVGLSANSKNYIVKKSFKGLKTYLINDSVRKLVNKELAGIFSKREVQKQIFNRYLKTWEIALIKKSLRQFDKNNYWLSFLLFLNDEKSIDLTHRTNRAALFSALKVVAILPFARVITRNNTFENTLFNLCLNLLKKDGIIVDPNSSLKSSLLDKEVTSSYQNVFRLVTATLKHVRAEVPSEVVARMVEFTFFEKEKSQYFVKNSTKTIFGSYTQKRLNAYVAKKSIIERNLDASVVNIPNANLYEAALTKVDLNLNRYQTIVATLTSEFSHLGWSFGQYQFAIEQTSKPYLRDKFRLSSRDYLMLTLNYFILLAWSLVIALPIFQVIYQAFNALSFNLLDTKEFVFSTESFNYLFNSTPFLTWFKNSIIAAVIVTVVLIFASTILAYALSRFRFKGRKSTFKVLTVLSLFPVALASTTFIILNQMLRDTFSASPYIILTIIWAGMGLLGSATAIKNYMDTISREIDEAAKIDGAGNFTVLRKIILPLIMPILSVIALQTFILPFVDVFFVQITTSDTSLYNVGLGLAQLRNGTGAANTYNGPFVAGSLVMAVPITLIYFASDFFMKKDKLQGAIKG